MTKEKTLFRVLVAINFVLLSGVVLLGGKWLKGGSGAGKRDLISHGESIRPIMEAWQESILNVASIRLHRIVFLVYEDSVHRGATKYIEELQKCAQEATSKPNAAIFVSRAKEKLYTTLREFKGVIIAFGRDPDDVLRRSFGVGKEATILVDGQTYKVIKSYPFILNPFVVCEQLESATE